jgi:hypothetical protein
MQDRRTFVRNLATLMGMAAVAGAGSSQAQTVTRDSERKVRIPARLLDVEAIRPQGDWIEATVPDSLDLAKHAEFSINVLTRNVEPNAAYSVYQGLQLAKQPRLTGLTWNITGKNIRALPWMRTMSGSDFNLDVESNMMRAMAQEISEDGQIYAPVDGDGVPKGASNPLVNALVVLAMANWYERDGNPDWKPLIAKLSDGLQRVALLAEDRAYYPLECGYRADGTWHYERRAGKQLLPYTPPEEPTSDQQGVEGAVKVKHARQVAALVKEYAFSGRREPLEMARKLSRFILKPGMWPDTSSQGYSAVEHGIFEGHFHANTHTALMLLDLAIAANDERLKHILRESYDHGRRTGIVRMGWFPAWTLPVADPNAPWVAGRRPQDHNSRTEGCSVADMLVLAVKLTDAGMGDYWDDVDHIVRNQLIVQQLNDLDLLRQAAGADTSHDELLRRFIGGFSTATPTYNKAAVHGCCTANCAIGLYYAWHGITRFEDGVARVNLFLNRASSWMDIDSYLPYEGKVVLRNKLAHTAHVRIPSWVRRDHLKSTVNGRSAEPISTGSHLVFRNLKPNDEIRIQFAVPASVDTYTIGGKRYTMTFRGSTLVDISPRENPPNTYPLYLRDSLKATQTLTRKVRRFIPKRVLPLQ